MSLSTQLTRGTLALPMLALFGVLALVANQAADAQPLPATSAAIVLHVVDAGNGACAALPRAPMLLAQAPADLGPIAHRALRISLATACRA